MLSGGGGGGAPGCGRSVENDWSMRGGEAVSECCVVERLTISTCPFDVRFAKLRCMCELRSERESEKWLLCNHMESLGPSQDLCDRRSQGEETMPGDGDPRVRAPKMSSRRCGGKSGIEE